VQFSFMMLSVSFVVTLYYSKISDCLYTLPLSVLELNMLPLLGFCGFPFLACISPLTLVLKVAET